MVEISIRGKKATFNGTEGWTCRDNVLQDVLDSHTLTYPPEGYYLNYENAVAEKTAKDFEGIIVKLNPDQPVDKTAIY